jgi:AcrR family transcriptional regulator
VDQPTAPARRDAIENRARIVSAAQQVFAAAGRAANLDDVARAAGVSPATFYRHFPTKEHLVRAVLDGFYRRLLSISDEALGAPPGAGLEEFLVTAGLEIAAQRGLASHLWGDLAPAEVLAELRDRTRCLLERAQQAHAVAENVTVDDVADAVRAMRGIIEIDGSAWHRHLDYVLIGFREGLQTAADDHQSGHPANSGPPAGNRRAQGKG